jgi:hypothetical protein
MDSVELFLKAFSAYKQWIECGKDFVAHAHLFEAWDVAVIEFAEARGVTRNVAACEVFHALELEKDGR